MQTMCVFGLGTVVYIKKCWPSTKDFTISAVHDEDIITEYKNIAFPLARA